MWPNHHISQLQREIVNRLLKSPTFLSLVERSLGRTPAQSLNDGFLKTFIKDLSSSISTLYSRRHRKF